MIFEWDAEKAAHNFRKHGIRFEEARPVFNDPLAWIFNDEAHSSEENREIIIGHSPSGRLLLVCFTECADVIRIYSARPATPAERKGYEENATS